MFGWFSGSFKCLIQRQDERVYAKIRWERWWEDWDVRGKFHPFSLLDYSHGNGLKLWRENILQNHSLRFMEHQEETERGQWGQIRAWRRGQKVASIEEMMEWWRAGGGERNGEWRERWMKREGEDGGNIHHDDGTNEWIKLFMLEETLTNPVVESTWTYELLPSSN